MFIFKFLGTASFIASTIANPVPNVVYSSTIGPEGIHLVDCDGVYSVVLYCYDNTNCMANPETGVSESCAPSNRENFGLAAWETPGQNCTFEASGKTFSWNICRKAQEKPDFSKVGKGTYDDRPFNIFKDDNHVMYIDGNEYPCLSLYYALNA